jgi:hypothetical protein
MVVMVSDSYTLSKQIMCSLQRSLLLLLTTMVFIISKYVSLPLFQVESSLVFVGIYFDWVVQVYLFSDVRSSEGIQYRMKMSFVPGKQVHFDHILQHQH